MSRRDYEQSRRLSASGAYTTRALLMAAMRQAEQVELNLLRAAFPELCEELERRVRSVGGGWVEGDPESERPLPTVDLFEEGKPQ